MKHGEAKEAITQAECASQLAERQTLGRSAVITDLVAVAQNFRIPKRDSCKACSVCVVTGVGSILVFSSTHNSLTHVASHHCTTGKSHSAGKQMRLGTGCLLKILYHDRYGSCSCLNDSATYAGLATLKQRAARKDVIKIHRGTDGDRDQKAHKSRAKIQPKKKPCSNKIHDYQKIVEDRLEDSRSRCLEAFSALSHGLRLRT